MPDVLTYSAPYAKIKSMARSLLNGRDYKELLSKRTVTEIATYLKNSTSYRDVLHNIKETSIHRAELEEIIKSDNINSFVKLTHFLSGNRRKFLNIYSIKYEINLIKLVMRAINSNEDKSSIVDIPDYFYKHSKLDFEKIMASSSINELIKNLYGSKYYDLLYTFISKNEKYNMFNLEIVLDMYYYKSLYMSIHKCLDKEDQKLTLAVFGAEIDLANILWIYRCKKYYTASKELIYAYLIPTNYKLTKSQTVSLIEAGNINDMMIALAKTKYANIISASDSVFNEKKVDQYLFNIYESQYHKNPFTIAKINAYFHIKQTEIDNLIKIIEGIRYNLDQNEIQKYLVQGKGGLFVGN